MFGRPGRVKQWALETLDNAVVNRVAATTALPRPARARLIHIFGYRSVHPRARISPHVTIDGARRRTVRVGAEARLGHDVYLGAADLIDIGDRASIGVRTTLITGTHTGGNHHQRAPINITTAPIHIGDGAWLGAGVIVLPGVTVGAGCIVGAGSVVTGDCEPDGLYVGSPARRVKDLPV